MKKNKIILLIMLFLFPISVFASEEASSELFLGLFFEVLLTAPISMFVLKPISKVFDSDKSNKLFEKLFIVRIFVLLFSDIFITPSIAILEFCWLFIGTFLVVPVLRMVKRSLDSNKKKTSDSLKEEKNKVVLNCKKCGSILSPEDKYCSICGTLFDSSNVCVIEDNSPVIQIDPTYLKEEKKILKQFLFEELESQGENKKHFTTISLFRMRCILLALFCAITSSLIILSSFDYFIGFYLLIEIIAFPLYLYINSKLSFQHYFLKQAIKNPDTSFSDLVSNVRKKKHISSFIDLLKYFLIILVVLILPSMFFFSPKLWYTKYEDGYSVYRYTRGLVSSNEEVIIPDTYKGKKVLSIGENAFNGVEIKTVKLPKDLKIIQDKAFLNCKNLETIDIPDTVQEIGEHAFENTTDLYSVTLRNGLKKIGDSAFKNASNLVSIELPDSLEYLGERAFSHCASLATITIPKKVVEIKEQTFEYCTYLSNVELHDDIITIYNGAFAYDSNLENIKLPPKITVIKEKTFEGCTGLLSINIPEGVTRIGGNAFYDCTHLSDVSIPITINEIGASAFKNCYSLEKIQVPYYTSVSPWAFRGSPTVIERYPPAEKR